MRKQCDVALHYANRMMATFGIALRFECTKRKGHLGRHKDAYGGTWRKEKN